MLWSNYKFYLFIYFSRTISSCEKTNAQYIFKKKSYFPETEYSVIASLCQCFYQWSLYVYNVMGTLLIFLNPPSIQSHTVLGIRL